RTLGLEAPACARTVALVHEAEAAGEDRRQWTGRELLTELQRARRRARRRARIQQMTGQPT
ncbi:hypothetical protein G6023_01155, partial [Dietzia sp. DQ11-71]|nr:hypothetical protein [Dietzia sp. DQ11-71]